MSRGGLHWLGVLLGRIYDLLSGPRRPSIRRPELDQDDASLASLVAQSPRGNAYLSLEPELRRFAHGDSVISWARWRRSIFTVGGLHGEGAEQAYGELIRVSREVGIRRVLAFPVSASERDGLHGVGFQTAMVGSEAMLDPRTFQLAGPRTADLRQMVNRGTQRHDLRVREVHDTAERWELMPIYERWLKARPVRHRMRLLIGTPAFERSLERRYFAVGSPQGEPCAFVTLTPGWSGRGYGLDVMARAPDAPAGAMEVLILGVIRQLGLEGISRLSLGACPMAFTAEQPENEPWLYNRVFRWLHSSSLGNQLFPFRSLTQFKAKFDPAWEPVFFAAWPRLGFRSLYTGCRMWGVFEPPPQGRLASEDVAG